MIDIERYITDLIIALQEQFSSRLVYVGLQGSYLRNEAHENSDVDIMAVIDGLMVADLSTYRSVIEMLPHTDKSCGFICSKADLANWNPLEIHHLLHTTKDYVGKLSDLIPAYTEQDIRNFVKMSLNNLYHEICHRLIHGTQEHNAQSLPGTYKGTFFILQNVYYLRHGKFITTKAELLPLLEGKDYAVLNRLLDYSKGIDHGFTESFELLFSWCQETFQTI